MLTCSTDMRHMDVLHSVASCASLYIHTLSLDADASEATVTDSACFQNGYESVLYVDTCRCVIAKCTDSVVSTV